MNELKANELRIGNYYNEFGIPKKATAEFILKLDNIQKSGKIAIDVSSIPLTEEWLLKCGFKKNNYYKNINVYFLECETFMISYILGINELSIIQNDYQFVIGEYKYLNEIQNWYYWNNNKKELEIKE